MSLSTGFESKTLTFILAGGDGERLYPLTADQPKPVVPFGGVFRIIDFTLSNVLNSGLRRVYVVTQYKHERLHSYVRDGWPQLSNEFRQDCGEEIICLPPSSGKRYLGTADALFQNIKAIEKSSAEHVLIVSGDQVYHMNYAVLLRDHAASGADLTMAAVQSPCDLSASREVIKTDPDGKVVGIEEKPMSRRLLSSGGQAFVNMGVYAFRKEALIKALRNNAECIDSNDIVRDILPFLIQSGRTMVSRFDGYWRDLSTLDLYYETNLDLLLAGAALDPYQNAAWPTRTLAGPKSLQSSWLASESRVAVDATLTACDLWMSIVSTGARIDADAELEGAIVLPGAHIGSGARIRNAIVAEKAVVPPHARIGYDRKADRSQFSVSQKGIVIVDAPGAVRRRVAWQASSRLP